MRLERARTALVVIDVQERLFPFIHTHEALANEIVRLVRGARRLELPIVVTEQYPKGLGPTIEPVREALGPDYKPLEKMSFSCAGDAAFLTALDGIGREQILLCGIETHVCVYQTAIDLLDRGYRVYLVEDAVGSRAPHNRDLAIRRIEQGGGTLTSVEMALFEILEVSGTPEFKAIVDLVK
jgi:nicotinamidase-related amidase